MRALRNRIIKKALIYAGVGTLISVWLKPQLSMGLLLGTGVSIVNFLFLEQQIRTTVRGKNFLFFSLFGYIIRYLFMGVALFFALKYSLPAFLGAAIGLFMVRLGIYGEKLGESTQTE